MSELKSRKGRCVGGPIDGDYQVCSCHDFYIPEMQDFVIPFKNGWEQETPIPIKKHRYVNFDIELNDDEGQPFYLWRPFEQTPRETLAKLIEGYSPDAALSRLQSRIKELEAALESVNEGLAILIGWRVYGPFTTSVLRQFQEQIKSTQEK